MLHELPITNVRLLACHEDWHRMTPTEQGRHCHSCNREVVDFTEADTSALTTAQAAAPDGRLCGRFRLSQLAPGSHPPRPQLRRRLREFLVVAVLVLVQGLTARQAWAQVPGHLPGRTARPPAALYALPGAMPLPLTPPDTATPVPAEPTKVDVFLGMIAERMPQPAGGMEGLIRFLRKNMQYPAEALRAGVEGKVFVSFTVTRTGQITGAHIVRGLGAGCDEEALRVVGLLPPWTPGQRNGQPTEVQYTIPITFLIHDEKPAKKRP